MLDRILIGSSAEPTDTNFKNVTLLLHGDGSNGAQNNTFIDSSTNNFTITRNGNTTQGSFSPYGSNWSNYFDGTSDYLTYTGGSSLNFGTGDFTIELFVFLENTGTYSPFLRPDASTTTPEFGYDFSSGQLKFDQRNGPIVAVTTTMPTNQWAHVAVSRSGTSLRLFINGAQVGSTVTNSTNWTSPSGDIRIGGSSFSSTHNVKGYISNFRVLNGTALYTGSYTVPTAPLTAITNTSLLTCADNRFRDGSTNNFTITRNGDVKVTNFAPFAPSSAYSTTANGGSAYFAGNEDFLTSPDNAAVQLGSGNFTIEMWVYFSAAMMADQQVLLFNGSNANSYGPYKLFYNGANNLKLYGSTNGSSWDIFNGLDVITTVVSDCWYHIALVRSGSTFSAYANGVRQSTASVSGSLVSTGTPVRIGAADAFGSYNFLGFISNFRMVKGTAVYDPSQTTLTVPTSPVTAITNTSLLLNATNAAIFDNSMKNDLETVGNAQISTSVKKFGTGSMAFDGSGDYLITPLTPALNLSSGNWTIEGWFYPNNSSTNMVFAMVGNNGSDKIVLATLSPNGYIAYLLNASVVISTTSAVTNNAWSHFALVKNGSTTTLYLNGTSVGTTTSVPTSSDKLFGAGRDVISGGAEVNGYVDEIRITNGVARYTANFTPPTAPFPNK